MLKDRPLNFGIAGDIQNEDLILQMRRGRCAAMPIVFLYDDEYLSRLYIEQHGSRVGKAPYG